MSTVDETLDQWLRDAHAMEKQAEQMLTAQAKRIEHYPKLHDRIAEHLEETRSQISRLERCLDRRGESRSVMKDAAGKVAASLQGFGGMFASDEVVKGGLASYTFEHFEIASYEALIAAADTAGDDETAAVCSDILREEKDMADWLAAHLPEVTVQFLTREETGLESAKR